MKTWQARGFAVLVLLVVSCGNAMADWTHQVEATLSTSDSPSRMLSLTVQNKSPEALFSDLSIIVAATSLKTGKTVERTFQSDGFTMELNAGTGGFRRRVAIDQWMDELAAESGGEDTVSLVARVPLSANAAHRAFVASNTVQIRVGSTSPAAAPPLAGGVSQL